MLLSALMLLGMMFQAFSPSAAFAADPSTDSINNAALGDATTVQSSRSATVSNSLWTATGQVNVVVRLKDTPLGIFSGNVAAQASKIKSAQDALTASMSKFGAQETARLSYALNAVVFSVDAAQISGMSKVAGISSINKLNDYEAADPVVTSAVGGTALQATGLKGQGMVVAVMDSGIDYTHANLSGPGTVAAYNTCYAQRDVAPSGICATLFGPTAPKAIGGIDFVGEAWPTFGPRTTDPNPIDKEGHGTHVADIIAGKTGMAPEAKVVSIKVCSAVATSCNGEALLLAADYVISWNMNSANASKKISVVNLSLGQSYGQEEDDLTNALNNVYRSGVVVVASAGNSADRSYIAGSPSIGFGVISVAQTSMPTDKINRIKINAPVPGFINYAVYQDWSPALTTALTGDIQWGVGADKLACSGYPAGSMAGKIALIDRGTCAASLKAAAASAAGAKAVIIANNVDGAPPSFSYGGGTVTIPTFTISKSDGLKLKVAGTNVTLDPALAVSVANTMTASSSRGPSINGSLIKPDIGAPGASLSAEVGTGNGQTVFGGTSGAAPVVSGAAVLLRQKYPTFTPSEIKSLLMTNADTNNKTLLPDGSLYATPITRIGGGEVRVDRAANSGLLAQVPEVGKYKDMTNGTDISVPYTTGSLSFGFQPIAGNDTKVLSKDIVVKNLTNTGRLYQIELNFRDPADQATGAVTLLGPQQFWLNGGETQTIQIQLMIEGQKLGNWPLTGKVGQLGGDGTQLNGPEFDGYIVLNGGANNTASLAWQVLPRKSSDTRVLSTFDTWNNGPVKALQLANDNGGSVTGNAEVFQLLGSSPKLTGAVPGPGDNAAVIDLKYFGVREVGPYIQFAINTWGQRATPNYPAEFDVYIDTNGDGTPDYLIYNKEANGFGSTGQNLVYVQKLSGGAASAYFYSITDFNTGNIVFTAPKSVLGLTNGTKFGAQLYAFDNYFTGNLTDSITGPVNGFATYTVGAPRFTLSTLPWTNPGTLSSDGLTISVPVNGTQVQINTSGSSATSSATGLLLMYDTNPADREAEAVMLP